MNSKNRNFVLGEKRKSTHKKKKKKKRIKEESNSETKNKGNERTKCQTNISIKTVKVFFLKSLGCQPLRVLNSLQSRVKKKNKPLMEEEKKKNLTQTVHPVHPSRLAYGRTSDDDEGGRKVWHVRARPRPENKPPPVQYT